MQPITDYLLSAYYQKHIADVDTFLALIYPLMGEGHLYDIHKYMCSKYGPPKLGTSRVAYISKAVVFKVPTQPDGFRYNEFEISLCSVPEIPQARTHYLYRYGVPIVVMEKVEEATPDLIRTRLGRIPKFVSYVDMGQVGFTKKGKLVAYDYADQMI